MVLAGNTLLVVNLVLCVVILAMALVRYKMGGRKSVLFIGLAFGLFGVSHLANILGYGSMLEPLLIVLRVIAYLLVIAALLKK